MKWKIKSTHGGFNRSQDQGERNIIRLKDLPSRMVVAVLRSTMTENHLKVKLGALWNWDSIPNLL